MKEMAIMGNHGQLWEILGNYGRSCSGDEVYCATCYSRHFGPGGRSKFGEKSEVQASGGDKGACLR